MKKLFVFAAAVVFALSACDGDKNKNNDQKLTPEEHKAKLEQIGSDLAGLINANDFQEFVDVINYMSDELPELPFFEADNDEPVPAGPVGRLTGVTAPLFTGKLAAVNSITRTATRAADGSIEDFYGIWEIEDGEWVNTDEEADKFEIRFTYDDEEVVITLADTGSSDFEVTVDDETIAIPNKANAKMVKGTATLFEAAVEIASLNSDATTGQVKVNVGIAGYTVSTAVDVTKTSANATVSVKKGSALLVSANAVASISGLDWEEGTELKNISGTLSIMDKAFLKGSCSDIAKYDEGWDDLDEEYYGEYDEEFAAKLDKHLNDNFSVFMNYDNSNTAIAKWEQKTVVEDELNYNVISYIVFSDGSRFSFEDYFEDFDYSSLEKALEKFESLFDF